MMYEKNQLNKKEFMQMPDNKIILQIYEQMLRIRLFEQKANELFAQGLVTGSMHLYIGQEAIAATAGDYLRETDTITSTHRGHGHCIAKGGKTDRMMAELLGRKDGYCGGKGGICIWLISLRVIWVQMVWLAEGLPSL